MSATTTPAPEFGVDIAPGAIPQKYRERAMRAAFKTGVVQHVRRSHEGAFCVRPEGYASYSMGFACLWPLAAIVYPIGTERMGTCDACQREFPVDDLVTLMAGGTEGVFCPDCPERG